MGTVDCTFNMGDGSVIPIRSCKLIGVKTDRWQWLKPWTWFRALLGWWQGRREVTFTFEGSPSLEK